MQLPPKRVAIYARVSTTDQTCEPQLRDLRAYVTARGWHATEFVDQGVSGTREKRPALDRLLREAKARRIDVVVVAAFDRFSRSVRHLVETLELFRHLGVEFVSLREQIDTGSPLGQAVFTIVAAIAELERSLIAERVRAGLRRARAEGRRLGRPPVAVDPSQLASAIRRNLPVREAARELRISASTYHRLARAWTARLGDGSMSGRTLTTNSPGVSETLSANAV
jgi:DNA invertase Pin-like site-specific DNA recombinase